MARTIIRADADDFDERVLARSGEVPVLVDYTAPGCAPCQALSPTLEQAAREYGGRFVLAKVDLAQSPALAERLGVRTVPTVQAIVDGEVVAERVGTLRMPDIYAFIEEVLTLAG